MNTIIIILAVIGLLKVVSLFILFIIKIYYAIIKVDNEGITRSADIFKDSQWYLIPTIGIVKGTKFLEISVCWLCFLYYVAYNINKDENEK